MLGDGSEDVGGRGRGREEVALGQAEADRADVGELVGGLDALGDRGELRSSSIREMCESRVRPAAPPCSATRPRSIFTHSQGQLLSSPRPE